ncbi:MAG: sigma 54-interacting transcriptional regulator [Myxococcota bacterium]
MTRQTAQGTSEAMAGEDLTLSFEAALHPEAPTPAHLVVVDGDSSWIEPLPVAGELVVGRSQDAHLRVAEPSVSRLHLKLMIAKHEVRAIDLGSSSGTRVNGERLTEAQTLFSGDVLELAPSVLLIFHRDAARAKERPLLDGSAVRARLEEELSRASSYHRPLSLIVLEPAAGVDRHGLLRALAGRTRSIDVPGFISGTRLALIAPELDRLGARALAARLLGGAPSAKIGMATAPDDANDPEALLAAASAAADAASVGSPRAAEETTTRRRAGDRSIIVADPAMQRLYALVDRLAPTEVSVLINGETGAGKELVALSLHHGSPRRAAGPFLAINCAALAETLVESQLFGHEKGAFSGADSAKAGLIEAAKGGTFFLDEVGELSLAVQAKLLRVIETQKVMRLGDVRERPIDVRFVAATHRDLTAEVKAGRFRQDLYYRVATAKIALPPLRHRPLEIPILADLILTELAERSGLPRRRIGSAALQQLLAHDWPGNVRELRNVLELAAATADGDTIEPWHLPFAASAEVLPPTTATPAPSAERKFRPIEEEVRELERARMAEALAVTDGNQTRAAELISMPLRTFVTKLKQYGLSSRDKR